MYELGAAYLADVQSKKAIALLEHVLREKIALSPAKDTLPSLHALASAYHSDGQVKKAIKLLEHVVTADSESQGTTETLPEVYQSHDIPIRGCLTLKIIGSKVLYSLTFSQESLSQLLGVGQIQDNMGGVPKRFQHKISIDARGKTWEAIEIFAEGQPLIRLKEVEKLPWNGIAMHFPQSTKGSLQVHYSTELKCRSETTPKRIGKRWRVE